MCVYVCVLCVCVCVCVQGFIKIVEGWDKVEFGKVRGGIVGGTLVLVVVYQFTSPSSPLVKNLPGGACPKTPPPLDRSAS